MAKTVTKVALLLMAFVFAVAARAAWPERAIKVVVPFSAGAGGDMMMRFMLDSLAKSLGQPVIIENREGAGGNIGTKAVAAAAPDGYTLLAAAMGNFAVNQHLYSSFDIDPLHAFEPITHLADVPAVLFTTAGLPVKNFGEFLAYAKTHKGDLNYGSAGIGTTPQLTLESLNRSEGMGMTGIVYRGSPLVMNALVAGDIHLGFGLAGAFMPQAKAGRLRALAVAGDQRIKLSPETPTFKELGWSHVGGENWWALVAPAGTPVSVLERINAAVRKAVAEPGVRKLFEEQGITPVAGTRKELGEKIASESKRWARTIRELEIRRID